MNGRAGPFLLALSYFGFVSIGLPDGLLGVATPSILSSFGIPPGALGHLLVSFAGGYLVASFASGWILSRMRVGTLLALSCLVTGLALLGYASAPVWVLVVAAGLPAGLGAGAIDAGLNTYVATHHGPRTANWIHACYGVGSASVTRRTPSAFRWPARSSDNRRCPGWSASSPAASVSRRSDRRCS